MKRICMVALAMMAVPALMLAQGNSCNAQHPTPENPTAILAVIGGAGLAWRSLRARFGK
ncbi:MAG TPA: PExPT-CTERM protein [Acidobacteriaceae bacterium]|nr:PExPT-CTERM protein [Acidobacteriaceae bacterium]